MDEEYKNKLNKIYYNHFYTPEKITKDEIIVFNGFGDSEEFTFEVKNYDSFRIRKQSEKSSENTISIIESEGRITTYSLLESDYLPKFHDKTIPEQVEILTRRVRDRDYDRVDHYNYYQENYSE